MTPETTTTFRFDGTHADTLDDGTPLAPGQHVKLTEEERDQPAARRMLAEGQLLEVAYDPDELDQEEPKGADEDQPKSKASRRSSGKATTTPASSSADD